MQYLLVVPLIVALALSVALLVTLGRRQVRRTAALAGHAHELGLIFSATDPFVLPRVYARMALMAAGHSQRAENVAYGRTEGLPLRTFDLRYEIGHGIARAVRHYHVVVLDFARPLGEVLMWPQGDLQSAPLDLQQHYWPLDTWACRGAKPVATLLQDCLPLRGLLGVESLGTNVMLWMPVEAVANNEDDAVDPANVARSVQRWFEEHPGEVSVTHAVENGRTV